MESTERKAKSQDKGILMEMSQDELFDFLSGDDDGMTRRRRVAETAYQKAIDGDVTLLKWFMEKDYGTPTHKTDVTSQGNKIESISVEIIRPDAS